MRLRLSNGVSFSVEFSAENAADFPNNLRRATLEYFSQTGRWSIAELHVATDGGTWISPRYPRSNAPFFIRFGQSELATFAIAVRANQRGTWFEYETDGLSNWVSV